MVRELQSWVTESGGSASNVLAGETPYGLGLLASEDLQATDVVIRLPSECLVSAERMLDAGADRTRQS